MKRSVLGLLMLVSVWGRRAYAQPSPSALRITALDEKSCVSEREVRAALQHAGVGLASGPAPDGPGTTRLEVLGTPEQLSVELHGPEDRVATTLLPPATCATATDVVVAFLVSTLAPVPTLPAVPTPAPTPALGAATLLAAVGDELARRGLQLAIEGVTLSIERDHSGTWFARVTRADQPSLTETIALGNFDDPSPPRIDTVTDVITLAVRRVRAAKPARTPREDALQHALARADDDLSPILLGAGELALGTTLLLVLAGGVRQPNAHFSFATAEDAFASASASVAVLGGGASFFVSPDHRGAVIGVTSFTALGALATAVTLYSEPGVPAYSTAALAAGSYSTAALLGLNAILRRPPISRLRAARRELGQRPATPDETRQIAADLAKSEPTLPAWLSYFPLIAGGAVSMLPAVAHGFADDERSTVAIVGAGMIAVGVVGAVSPSNYTRYQRELRQLGLSDIAFGAAPGARYGISLSGRF